MQGLDKAIGISDCFVNRKKKWEMPYRNHQDQKKMWLGKSMLTIKKSAEQM